MMPPLLARRRAPRLRPPYLLGAAFLVSTLGTLARGAPQELGLDLSTPEPTPPPAARPPPPAPKAPPAAAPERSTDAKPAPAPPPRPPSPPERPPTERPAPAAAQGTSDAPGGDAALGLDLSSDGEGVSSAYRPVVGILPVLAGLGSSDALTLGRARLLEAELVRIARAHDGFQAVVTPSELDAKLGADAASARACVDWPCFERVAAAAGVHRLVAASVEKLSTGATIHLRAYDPSLGELLTMKEEYAERAQRSFAGMAGKSQQQKERDFARAMAEPIGALLGRIRTPNGRLVVDCGEPSVEIWVDGRLVGTGATEVYLPRGPHTVRARSDEFLPFEQVTTVTPGADTRIAVTLVAKPIAASTATGTPRPGAVVASIVSRPGFVVAAAGIAAVATGLVLGQLAQGIEARGATPDAYGIVAVTRAEAKLARTEALLANVLVAAGGAAALGGSAWLVVSVRRSAEAPTLGAPAEPGELRGLVTLGGSF